MNAQVDIQNIDIQQEVVNIISNEYSYISEYIQRHQNINGYYRLY